MGWLVITVLFALVFGGCVVTMMGATSSDTKLGAGIVAGLATIIWIFISVGMSIHTVGQRQVGIVYNFSGTITGKVDPGVAWTAPWQHIKKENVGLQRESFDLDPGNSAVSKDQQPIFAKVTLNYQVEPSQVVQLFKTVGPAWKVTLLDSRVLQDFKEVTAGFTAQEITTSREALRAGTKQRLIAELAKYDIRVIDFFVTNIDYADAYKAAISQKNVQVQQSLQAQAKVAQARAEADQNVATAEGHARATVANATADATALRLKGNALRSNPEILQLEAIDKLNPNATVIICTGTGTGNCPSFLPASAAGN